MSPRSSSYKKTSVLILQPGKPTDRIRTEQMLIDKAQMLSLSAPEMVVLLGGLRALNANWDGSNTGILTKQPGKLTNDFFLNLLDNNLYWQQGGAGAYEGMDRKSGEKKWEASRVDLFIGSHPELRAIAEAYASAGSQERFVKHFVAVWDKVMNLDRFDFKGVVDGKAQGPAQVPKL